MTHDDNRDAAACRVSVIVPMYNAAETIVAQLEALLDQETTVPFEIVVSDNGSSDNGAELVQAMANVDHRLRLLDSSSVGGPSHARNAGAAHATGSLLLFCDADDVVAPGWLTAMTNALDGAAVVAGPLELTRLNGPGVQKVYGTKLATEAQSFLGIFSYGASANLAVHRSVFNTVGGFDESMQIGEDIEICFRLWQLGHVVAFVPEGVVHYRLRSSALALWQQAYRYGVATPLLVRRLLEAGHPVDGRIRGVRRWFWLAKALPTLGSQSGRRRWIVVLSGCLGRVVGSARHRTVYL